GSILEDLDGAGLAGIAMDESLLFQGGEVAVHGRTARQPERRPDLADRRRISSLLHVVDDVIQNLALPLGQPFTHAITPPTPARLPASQRPDYNTRSSGMQTHVRPSVRSFALPVQCVVLGPSCLSQLLEQA